MRILRKFGNSRTLSWFFWYPCAALAILCLLLYSGCGLLSQSGVGEVEGIVMDSNNRPISGVRVFLYSNYQVFDITNKNGQYKIDGIDAQDTTFVFQKNGYLEKREIISLKRDQVNKFDVVLNTTAAIQNISVTPFASSVFIDFQTNNITRTDIFYGLNTNLDQVHQDYSYSQNHSIQISNLQPQHSYFFRIEAVSDTGNIEKSEIQSFITSPAQPLEIPKNLKLFEIAAETKATLSWELPISTDVLGYNLYRSNNRSDGFEKVNSSLIQTSYYENVGLTQGQNYVWYVKSVNSENTESPASNQVSLIAPGLMMQNSSLKKENNPHFLPADLIINRGATFEVGPGTIIYIAESDALFTGLDSSRVEISVNGTIRVLGSPLDQAFFSIDPQSNPTPEKGQWAGIYFSSSSDSVSSSFNNAKLFYALTAIQAEESTVEVIGTLIKYCGIGLNFYKSTNVSISSNTLQFCDTGIRIDQAASTASGNTIEKNKIENCNIGLIATNNQALYVKENHFKNNSDLAVQLSGGSDNSFYFNLIESCKDIGLSISGYAKIKNNTIQAKNAISISDNAPDIYNNIFLFENPLEQQSNSQFAVLNSPNNSETPTVEKNIIDPTFNQAGVNPAANFIEDPKLDTNFVPESGSPALDNKGRNGENIGRYI
ncbi:right-handed parallel beta-helix repeat-containing protein [Candidatus Riflebacteria bacterium]